MNVAKTKQYIIKLKSQLGKVDRDSKNGMVYRKIIGELLLQTDTPHMDFSLEHCGYVLDFYDVSKKQLAIDFKIMNDNFIGLVSNKIVIQSIVGKYIAGVPIKYNKQDEEEVDDEEIFPPLPVKDSSVTIISTKKDYNPWNDLPKRPLNKINYRVMPIDIKTGVYKTDRDRFRQTIDDLYYIKDASTTKDGKFYEVIDMIKQYQFALRDVEFEEKQRVRDEKFDRIHIESITAMTKLATAMESANKMFAIELGDTVKPFTMDDLSEELQKKAIELSQTTRTGSQINEAVMKSWTDAEKKAMAIQDLQDDTSISGKYKEPTGAQLKALQKDTHVVKKTVELPIKDVKKKKRKPKKPKKESMPITTMTYPDRLLKQMFDKDGKSIAWKNFSEELQTELRSFRAHQAQITKKRNKLLKAKQIEDAKEDAERIKKDLLEGKEY